MSLVDKVIWHIETARSEPLTLEELAHRCAISRYHLARVFRTATGLSPMTYLRARRLSVAAVELADGDTDILTAALDADYQSHAAFTRAFVAYFGVTPNTVRTARSTETLSLMEPFQMKTEMIVDVPAPELKERDAFHVVGLGTRCTFDDISAIPGLWHTFNREGGGAPDAVPGAAYGVCFDGDDKGFRYVAGYGSKTGECPNGMEKVSIPAGRYAVFTHKGHISDFPKTVYTIWNKSLPDHGLETRKAPDFEVYDSRFDVESGRGEVEVWIPIT